MYAHEKKVLKRITERLKKRFSERIVSVYAFGSRVREDHDGWFNFDVLIVVRDKKPKIEHEIVSIIVDEEMKRGISFMPMIRDIRSFEMEKKYHTPFYEKIIKEGILF